jgi:hypothetical protein
VKLQLSVKGKTSVGFHVEASVQSEGNPEPFHSVGLWTQPFGAIVFDDFEVS